MRKAQFQYISLSYIPLLPLRTPDNILEQKSGGNIHNPYAFLSPLIMSDRIWQEKVGIL